MVYFDNTTETQRVHIPRTNIEASAYHPSSGGTERYYAGTNIEITPTNIINVTGLTEAIQETVSGMTLNYATTGDVETMISAATSDFVTSGDVQSQITSQTQNFVTSGDVETMVSGFTTTGDVETMITAATSGLATTQDVENAVSGKADTTAVTQSISSALTAYTPTSNFATINGSGITSGGNIVIESGGDSTALEMITELPSDPVDGAVYNYNGVLVRYVDGPGNWGEWAGFAQTGNNAWDSNSSSVVIRNQYALNYTEIPASLDGSLFISFQYFTSNYIYFYFDLVNECVIAKTNSASTTVDFTIQHNGSEVQCNFSGSRYVAVSWFDNIINFNYSRDTYMANILQPTASTGHFELVEEPKVSETSLVFNSTQYAAADKNYYGSSTWGEMYVIPKIISSNGKVLQMGMPVTYHSQQFNGRYYKGWAELIYDSSKTSIPSFWAPTASGNQGELLVSDGQNGSTATPPVWKTVTQILGIDFWTGSQDDYDAMASHNATTLYIIIPDNS